LLSLQLDGLIDQCVLIIEETINVKTVARYYEAATLYGAKNIEKACLAWLKVNLLSHLPEHPEHLREISSSLMSALINAADLFVMQTEFSVYVLLR
jgi:BTB/POZ domain-containing protein 13